MQNERKPALRAPVRLRVGVHCHRYNRVRRTLTSQNHVDVSLPTGMADPGVLRRLRRVVILAIRAYRVAGMSTAGIPLPLMVPGIEYDCVTQVM